MDIVKFRSTTDDQGNFRIDDAPEDPMTLYAYHEGFAAAFNIAAKPGDPVAITLLPHLRISGSVIGAQTRQPIDAFTVIPGLVFANNKSRLDRDSARSFVGGKYEIRVQFPNPSGHNISVEAKGYLPAASRTFAFSEASQTCNFELVPGVVPRIYGILRLPDGRPAAAVTVRRLTKSEKISVTNGRVFIASQNDALMTKTNDDGTFSFPPTSETAFVFAVSDVGYALAKASDLAENPQLTITPWGRIKGEARSGFAVVPNAELFWKPSERDREKFEAVRFTNLATADDEGRFVLDRVPAFRGTLYQTVRRTNLFSGSHTGPKVEVAPGETLVVTVGGGGRTVIGRIASATNPPLEIDFNRCAGNLVQTVPKPPIPEGLNAEESRAWRANWEKTPEGKAMRELQEGRRYYPVRFEDDGSIHVEDVRPGAYELRLSIVAASDKALKPAPIVQSVVVPEMPEDGSDPGPLDLGTIKVKAP